MARKHYYLIMRREIANFERFVVVVPRRPHTHDFVFFAGHRKQGTQNYDVRVYTGHGVCEFTMSRTHGKFYINDLRQVRGIKWRWVEKFYRELGRYGANDLGLALCDGTSRAYITVQEAVERIATDWAVPIASISGLASAVVFASMGWEWR